MVDIPAVLKDRVQFCVAHSTSLRDAADVTCLQEGIDPVTEQSMVI